MRHARIPTITLCALLVGGCQNWDLLEPDPHAGSTGRAFTRLGDEAPEQLTNEVAIRRLQEIEQAVGARRIELIDLFTEDFPESRMIPEVHELTGEGYLTAGRAEDAVSAFGSALMMRRTDLLGLPLDTDLPLQLAMAKLAAGDVPDGLRWLARTSIADSSPPMQQALRWAHSQYGEGEFDDWLGSLLRQWQVEAPGFSLPGLRKDLVVLEQEMGRATLINFWSPT